MNRPFLIALGLLIGAVALVCWQFPGGNFTVATTQIASPKAPDDVLPPRSASMSVPSVGKFPRSEPVPDDDRPFAEVRAELESQAAAGDGHAAWRLGMALANCNGYVPISDERLESSIVDAFASGMIRTDATPDAMLQKFKLGSAQKRRDCRNVLGLNESDKNNDANKKAFHWIELGASLGDADAQAMYAALAFEPFEGRNALADAEQIREFKRHALDYLNRSLAQGDALALQQFSRFHANGLLFPANAEIAYSYLYAFSLSPRAMDFVPGYLEVVLASASQDLDAIAQERAREAGRSLATCCMTTTGKQP
ncbi:MAG: hypothetical protein IPP82_16240 [Xanthomonadales bacterium]|nr:hypothetical protein [Xanthomonadales bacterium]